MKAQRTKSRTTKNDLLAALAEDYAQRKANDELAPDEFTIRHAMIVTGKSFDVGQRYIDKLIEEGKAVFSRYANPNGRKCKIYRWTKKKYKN
jgi:hypothetical protein